MENKEKAKARLKAWRAKNPDKRRLQRQKEYAVHRDKILERNRKWHADNRERARDRNKRWHAKNPSRVGRHKRTYYLKRAYGMNTETIAALRAKQNNSCAICGCPLLDGWRAHIDHDHSTGIVRGILCHRHNTGLGFFRDSIDELRAAISYLEGAHV